MFNYICFDEKHRAIIYNSSKGCRNIRLISSENTKIIEDWFTLPIINTESRDNELFDMLVELGYFVPVESDEKLCRQMFYMENIMNDNLLLVIHTTENCNFRCRYCALDFMRTSMSFEVQNSIIKFVEKNISKYKSVTISWFGGEPLLQMDVIENISSKVIDICNRAKKPFKAIVTTNGYYLTPQNMEKLIKYKVYQYMVTIDGAKNTHDKQRVLINGRPTFDQIINNLKYIRDNIKFNYLNIIIRTNLTRQIMSDFDEYYCFFNNEFGGDKRFSLFIRMAQDWGGDRIETIREELLEESDIDFAYQELSKSILDINYHYNFQDLNPGGSTCSATFKNKFTISVRGDIYKCDSCIDEYKVGYLTKSGELVLDKSEEAKWILSHRSVDDECDNCFFSYACFQNVCPKSTIFYKRKNCALKTNIDDLLKFYVIAYNLKEL